MVATMIDNSTMYPNRFSATANESGCKRFDRTTTLWRHPGLKMDYLRLEFDSALYERQKKTWEWNQRMEALA